MMKHQDKIMIISKKIAIIQNKSARFLENDMAAKSLKLTTKSCE